MLYNVRYEIAVSEMMESNMNDLEMYIRQEFAKEDKDDTGIISVQQCGEALRRCKKLNLTPFQVHQVIGLSDCDGDGNVPYREFAPVCKTFIEQGFKFDSMQKKQQLVESKRIKVEDKHNVTKTLDEMELFRTFKKYDRNMNGTLDFSEYTQCLAECPGLDLTKQEIITTALAADLNCDGCIDFEEFMKHFTDILDMINYQRGLQEGFMQAEQ